MKRSTGQNIFLMREPGNNYTLCLGQSPFHEKINVEKAKEQHFQLARKFEKYGKVMIFDSLEDLPDGVFIEDNAVIVSNLAILLSSPVPSRQGEVDRLEEDLERAALPLSVERIQSPGFMEGGDCLITEDHLFIGINNRTNKEGVEQLSDILGQYAIKKEIKTIDIGGTGLLHLKSGASYLRNKTILVSGKCNFEKVFSESHYKVLTVPQGEERAANCVVLPDGRILLGQDYKETKGFLEGQRYSVESVNISEFIKGDGSMTCLSIIIHL